MYAGHSKQAGLIASQCHAGAYVNRFVVVVDEDINPADIDKVIWAMCTRFDPREGMEVLRGCWSSALDPMAYSEKDPRNARVVIDACKPFGRRDTFPREVRASAELEKLVRDEVRRVRCRNESMTDKLDITLTVNGRDYPVRVEPRRTLVDTCATNAG